jgi:hypothetical protein
VTELKDSGVEGSKIDDQMFTMKSEEVGRPSVASDDLVQSVEQKFVKNLASQFQNFPLNFHKLHTLFSMRLSQARLSQVSRKMDSENADGCAHDAENGFGFEFLERYRKDGDKFLNHILRVTDDEIWVSFVNVEIKEQAKQWLHTQSPNKPKK